MHAAPVGTQESHWPQPTPVQVEPVPGSAQVSPEQQDAAPSQVPPTVAQLWQVPPLHTRPRQQSPELPQDAVSGLQVSQMPPAQPSQMVPFGAMQERAGLWLQQSVDAVQLWSCPWQVCGTAHFPAMHDRAGLWTQQSPSAAQVPPVDAQTLADSQVPLVAPGAIWQVRPEQQSVPTVQEPWRFAQGGAQVPPAQLLEQQSLATVQASPLLLQEVGTLHW